MKEEITKYYNNLAKDYDVDRFSNSYGVYIHRQENEILKKYLSKKEIELNLDLACGTGRFLKYADYGLDISPEMVKVSKNKFPNKNISIGDAENLSYEHSFFQNVISFHLLMHLDLINLEKILSETHRVLKNGGYFIFDIPSQKRRNISQYKSSSWHGSNQISLQSLNRLLNSEWELVSYHGIAFFPIHRIPVKLRKIFIKLDNLLCNSFLKEYSSYLTFVLKKR